MSALDNIVEKTSQDGDIESKPASEVVELTKPTPPSFPDGGREAWTVVAGAWLAIFVSFGFLNSFAVFQSYYKTHQLSHKTPSDISWIGSFQSFCIYIMGSVFGALFDKFGPRPVLIGGGIGFSFSCMMQSLCKEYWQFFLAQSLVQGLSLSALFAPSFACVNHWFFRRRGLALGIATSGASVGGVIWPILMKNLIAKVDFPWAIRIMGFIALALSLVAAFTVKGRLPKKTGPEFFALHLYRRPAYAMFCAGMFFVTFGIFFLLFYLPSYGSQNGFDANMVFYAVSVLNAGSFFGRILPGLLADSWGRYNSMVVTALACSVLVFSSIAARSTATILVVGALYGFTSGNVLSLQGACVPPLLDDPRTIGVAIGQVLSVSGIGAMLGPPICGWIIAGNGGDFKGAQIFAGVLLAVGSVFLIFTRQYLVTPNAKWIV